MFWHLIGRPIVLQGNSLSAVSVSITSHWVPLFGEDWQTEHGKFINCKLFVTSSVLVHLIRSRFTLKGTSRIAWLIWVTRKIKSHKRLLGSTILCCKKSLNNPSLLTLQCESPVIDEYWFWFHSGDSPKPVSIKNNFSFVIITDWNNDVNCSQLISFFKGKFEPQRIWLQRGLCF